MHAATSIHLSLQPSRRLLGLIAVAHLAAFASVFLARIDPLLSAVLLLLVGASWVWQRRQWRRNAEISELILRGDGAAEKVRLGGTVPMHCLETSQIGNWMAILRWRANEDGTGPPSSLVLLADSLVTPDEFRRLRRWLIWRSPVSVRA